MNHILQCHEIVKTDFVHGQGCYLYDSSGRRYIDFEAGSWCTALGHSHPRINRVLQIQIEAIAHLGVRYPNMIAEGAALEVLDIVGIPDGKCIFLSSGSEAVEFGVQAARRINGKPLLLTFAGSYLAAYGSAGRKGSDEWHCFDWKRCAACLQVDVCDPDCDRLSEIPFERIGGLALETGNTFGFLDLPTGPVQMLVSLVRERQGLVISNEITTGMGRTGKWFGFQHYGLQPDIVAMGKGLGNGYPVSAVAMSREVARDLEAGGLHYAQSHQNDPLGCSVAREVITVMREDELVERSERIGAGFAEALREISRRHVIVKEVSGRGLMLTAELDGDCGRFSVASLYYQLLERGFLVGYNAAANLLRFYPALTMGEDDVAQLVENLGLTLQMSDG